MFGIRWFVTTRFYQQTILNYKEELESLIDSGRYDTADNFTVVLQPFQTSIVFNEVNGENDLSHLEIDCFHLSAEGNRYFALGLWNTMLQRNGEKGKILSLPVSEVACPDENQYFYTAQNSSKMIIIANYTNTRGLSLSQNAIFIATVQPPNNRHV